MIDTRDKRSSAVMVGLPWRGQLPAPDGSLNQGDRQQAGLMYRGIPAGAYIDPIFVLTTGSRLAELQTGRRLPQLETGERLRN